MLNQTFAIIDTTLCAEVGLAIFVTVFFGALIWTMTRSRGDIQNWSSLPLQTNVTTPESQAREEARP